MVIKPSEFVDKTAKVIEKILQSVFSSEEGLYGIWRPSHCSTFTKKSLESYPLHRKHSSGKDCYESSRGTPEQRYAGIRWQVPTIVTEDANVRLAAQRIAWGKWTGAGQTCLAPDLIYVHRSHATALVKGLKTYLTKAYDNDAIQSNHYCSLIHERHFTRQQDFLQEAKDAGAEIAYGGSADVTSLRMEPTIVLGDLSNTAIMTEEIFGPIMPIMVYDSLEELVTELQQ